MIIANNLLKTTTNNFLLYSSEYEYLRHDFRRLRPAILSFSRTKILKDISRLLFFTKTRYFRCLGQTAHVIRVAFSDWLDSMTVQSLF